MQGNVLITLAAVGVCSLDALVLGVIWQRAARGSRRDGVGHALVVGLSHALFAAVGLMLYSMLRVGDGSLAADLLAVVMALLIAAIGFGVTVGPGEGSGRLRAFAPLMLIGVDAVVIGLVGGSMGVSSGMILLVAIVVPGAAFGLPVVIRCQARGRLDGLPGGATA